MMPASCRLFTNGLPGWSLTAGLPSRILALVPSPKKRVKVQRLEIHLDPPLLAWLRLEAKRLDVSISEVLRRLVRREMGV